MKSAKSHIKYIIPAVAARLLLVPGVVIPIGVLFHYSSAEMVTLLTLTASPCAVSSYTMAYQYGADSDLAGELVVFSTLFSAVTIVMFVYILKNVCPDLRLDGPALNGAYIRNCICFYRHLAFLLYFV